MRLFDRIKKIVACIILTAYLPSQAWAQGITIPVGSTLNLNTGNLTVSGAITNAGTLSTTTGAINVSGNWTNSGTFNAGTSTVSLNGAVGTQTVNTGGVAANDAFYNLTHNGAGTAQLIGNNVLVTRNFNNTAGNFNANSLTMTVNFDWDNSATFTPGTGTVVLGGANGGTQKVMGTTTFYDFIKTNTAASTLTFDHAGTQSFTHSLTMQGALGQLLTINSDLGGQAAAIALSPTGLQTISYVNVQDSNAGVSPAQQTLVGRFSPDHTVGFNNTNWEFGNAILTWTGATNTDWNTATNWTPLLVPAPGDTVIVPGGPPNQPVLSADVTVANLTIQNNATVNINGHNMTVTSTFANSGTFALFGNETTISLTQDTVNPGTWEYLGDGTNNPITIIDHGATDYYHLLINDTNVIKNNFVTNSAITTAGNVTVTSGTLDISTNTDTLTVNGDVIVNGANGTLTATNGNITANANVNISNGVLTAPAAGKVFTVTGNFTHTGGTFNNSNGLVTLNGTDQSLNGNTTFYQLTKSVAAAHTLTFDHTGTQTITNKLIMNGAAGNLLSIRSDLPGTQAGIALSAGGLQVLGFLDVKDSFAGTPPAQVTLAPNNSVDSGHNTNWIFGGLTMTWTGATSTDWNTATNWDAGFVPRPIDSAVIANAANQPILPAAVTVNNLTINTGSSLTLAGHDLTVSSTFINNGNLILEGIENLTLTQDTNALDHGTFTYVGDGSGNPIVIKDFGAIDYYNLTINDPHNGGASPNLLDSYTISNNALHTLGTVTLTRGSLDMSAGTAQVDGGVAIAAGNTLKAPSGTTNTSFTVGGNWSNAGTFTNDGGKVTFDGTNQSISGNNTFAYLRKVVASADTFTLDHTATQTVTTDLTLAGAANPNRLSLVSDSPGQRAGLILLAGGVQNISDLSVLDSNAGVVPANVTLIDRNDYHDAGNNINWLFGNATLTWKGTTSTDWNTPTNWDLGMVPIAGDTVIIANAANQPILATPVSVGNLTINSGSTLTLNGQGLTVSTAFLNNGNVILEGNEALTLTMDSTHGTFTYVGDGNATQDTRTLTINGSPNVAYNNLVINDPNGTAGNRDIFASNGTVTVNGDLTVTSSTLNASSNTSNLAVTGSVNIAASGILDAPSTGSFTVGDNFANSGTFNNSSGTVTFNTAANATISGNNTFFNLTSIIPGKTIQVTGGSTQTVTNKLTLQGGSGNFINFISTGAPWNLAISATQNVSDVNLEGSHASVVSYCLNCSDSGNNVNWVFETFAIDSPASATQVGQTPTIIGTSPPNATVYIRDISNNLVATTLSDANGNFRVAVGKDDGHTNLPITPQMALGANSLTPYLTPALLNPGNINNFTVLASTTPAQVPTVGSLNGNPIVNITATQVIAGNAPVIAGTGNPGEIVRAQALDANGNLILTASLGTVDGSGNYSVTWPSSTPLPGSTNYLSITVGHANNETTSPLITIVMTDPFGYVFNSNSNQVITGATVTLYDATTEQPVAGTLQSCNIHGTCCDMSGNCCTSGVCTASNPPGNPFTTSSDGFYSFLVPPGQYYLKVAAGGYNYPSKVTTVPPGRSVAVGSKGENFTVGNVVFELDQPMDGNSTLLHIVKTANKSEGSVGDIVTYTVNIQNLSSTEDVNDVLLADTIPPGFKYVKDRVLRAGIPVHDPTGPRPLVFDVGSVLKGSTQIMQYQLVIGSGVTMGTYKNVANAIQIDDSIYQLVKAGIYNGTGLDLNKISTVVSNPAEASVKIIPDPVFDLGSVIGKVYFDWNENGIQDPPFFDPISHQTIVEKPVPNVQIVMEDGTIITTDRDGKFNIPGLLPGRHLFRLDERTLPPGAYLTTTKGVIVDVTAGSISKVNFGVNIDQTQVAGRDAVFFNEKIRLTQDNDRPVPRLNAALFDASSYAKPDTEEVVLNQGALVRQAEFRIFTNYSPFITSWRLDILDADTRKVIRSFEGTPLNINDPVYWNGRDDHEVIIDSDHKYSYVLSVMDDKFVTDTTKEKPITVREIKDDVLLKKEKEETKDILRERADRYRKWIDAQGTANNIDKQLIPITGQTIHLDRQGTDVKSIHVMKGNQLFIDIPLSKQYGLTPDELVAGGFSTVDEKDNLEIILPNGDYSLDVVSTKPSPTSGVGEVAPGPGEIPAVSSSSGLPSLFLYNPAPGLLEHYSRPLKVGEDYMMFVALGDAQVGYNIDRGNIEPIQDPAQQPGFYKEGKGAFYLKGKILGKYLVTSSFDSDRAQKALFRQLDPNVYYPVYGDSSSINYAAADTQGPLYLRVDWDKSTAILGNYAIDFKDTEFAKFSRAYYGGKIDYQSVASNPYGDARTKLVVYHAQVQQLPSHNEFLATGGSLYFLKYKHVVQGSDSITIQVRDATTGLVVASQKMINGADYELDLSQGRILFWQPVAMIAQSESIITNSLVTGNPIYVVADYQYEASGIQQQTSQGARFAQGVGDNLVLGGTYVQDNANGQNFSLQGTDATLHLAKDATIKAEYAQTVSQDAGSFVSTDGGITFTSLSVSSSNASGKAFGITGDARLFDNIGLKSYYKWIGSDFGATSNTSQQGKIMTGLSVTWDMTPLTRLTASEDIQKLIQGGNLQTSAQVGASETDTTMVQIVHQAEKMKLTGQFQLTETKSVINGIESVTNQRGAVLGGQAQYDLTNRIKLTLGQQIDVQNTNNTATTVGMTARVTDTTAVNAQEVFASNGRALTAGVTNQLNKRIALTTAYTLTNLNTGEVDKTASVALTDQINNNITTSGSVAMTGSSNGTTTTSASIGTKAKLADGMTVDVTLGKSQSSTGAQGATSINLNGTTQIGNTTLTATAQGTGGASLNNTLVPGGVGIGTTGILSTTSTASTAFGLQAVTKVNPDLETNGSVNVANDLTGIKTTTFGFGQNSKIDKELQAVTSNSFAFSQGSVAESSKYGLVHTNATGQKVEANFTSGTSDIPGSISQSNIFGLTGDVNDKLALQASIERGKVQNLDKSRTDRTDISIGAGYVLKDTETAVQRLQNSIKLEFRMDKGTGTDSLHQFVFYDALQGKITDNWTVNAKLDYSKTIDTTTNSKSEQHKEIILGMAYRPVNFDNLNLITEYSYQEGYGGGTQQADALNALSNQTIAQVFSAEAVYDINEKWQLAEKAALRIQSEQDTGFQFTQTHTWLVIHRLNYKIDRNWTISGEYRSLVQVEAKDNKQGVLVQATRELNDNTELAIGWNFTTYTDDLTNLSYTSLGPFIRMTGKFYDETPEEKARARAKWLDARINVWAWKLISKELGRKDSKIVLELNRMFSIAKAAEKSGRLEESKQIYKDIIAAGQMMYDEASQYIRGRIAFEEQLQQMDRTARDYYKGGEYLKARKIWEKVVDDASKGVVK